MATIHDNVFDAALDYIAANGGTAVVVTVANAVLADVALDAGNFTGPADNGGAGGGRKLTCLTSDGGDMSNIDVDSAGDATKVRLLDAASPSIVLIETAITGAPITLGADDQVNLGTFDVILKDPT